VEYVSRDHGRVKNVAIRLRNNMREGFVTFTEPLMAEMARRQLNKLVFFDHPLEVELEMDARDAPNGGQHLSLARQRDAWPRFMGADRGGGERLADRAGDRAGDRGGERGGKADLMDEMDDPLATCRLMICDLDPSVEESHVAAVLKPYGAIDSIFMRREAGFIGGCSAEVKLRSLTSSVRAKRELVFIDRKIDR
jgi:RNA recognition motif-containing protein